MSKRKNIVRRERTFFEWVILGVSLAAIAAIVAGLVLASLGYDSSPADLGVAVEPKALEENRFMLVVKNRGGVTAEDVRVEVRRGAESTEVEFRAVPKGHEEEALVELDGSGTPRAQILSYRES